MKDDIRSLFRAVADLPAAEREMVYRRRRIPAETRAELESLLGFDAESSDVLGGVVSSAAEQFLLANAPGLVGGQCGPYRLVRFLGSGGAGAVYLAAQGVAVRLLRSGVPLPPVEERRRVAGLNHPGIARLLDAGYSGGYGYLASEYVNGPPIDSYASRREPRQILEVFLQVCDVVAHAHRRAVVHGNLKPSNILVESSGRPKVLDFGAPKGVAQPEYEGPERPRGDVRSLGAVLKTLTGGVTPRGRGLSRRLKAVVRKAVGAAAEERYASVETFRDDLQSLLG